MALGGGTFQTQNKVLPGVYVNFVSQPSSMITMGERGTACLLFDCGWGEEGMQKIEAAEFQTKAERFFGYSYNAEETKILREICCGAKTLLCYRPNGGAKAEADLGLLHVTAKYSGLRGNDIRISITENVDTENAFDVTTFLGTKEMDRQTIKDIAELEENDFVIFSGEGAPTADAGKSLSGGTNASLNGENYEAFLAEAEKETFQALCYEGEDTLTKALFAAFTKRMRDEQGVKFVTVLYDYAANHEGIINVKTDARLVPWVTGMSAGAQVNESLTNREYSGAYEISAPISSQEAKEAIQNGQFVFYMDASSLRVLRDINSFTDFASDKNSTFSSNRVMRVLDGIANDVATVFSKYYLGKQSNHADGRNLFQSEIITYCDELQQMGAIENFSAADIVVEQGAEKQDVVISLQVQPVDAMEKLYMQVEII